MILNISINLSDDARHDQIESAFKHAAWQAGVKSLERRVLLVDDQIELDHFTDAQSGFITSVTLFRSE
jgi:hypothetical protein